MKKTLFGLLSATLLLVAACAQETSHRQEADAPIDQNWLDPKRLSELPFSWANATVYFMLTDRFFNGNPDNDFNFDRKQDGAVLRDYKGGDLQGIIQKIESGYFDSLGVNAIWFTPPYENIHGFTDEGTGKTYAFHGYWPRDWTAIDPNLGTMDDLKKLVDKAHERGIRVLLDVIINHTGPVTEADSQWPDEWVRTDPPCTFEDFESTVFCELVENLPDIRTERNEPVDLPAFLKKKWEQEGRLAQEMQELDAFFKRTGYPRAPRYYLIKWLTDYVRELGFDGFRVDTAKHVQLEVWTELLKEAKLALEEWKQKHPAEKLDDTPFFMMAETYNYGIWTGEQFDMGDTLVNFFKAGFDSQINFSFKGDAKKPAHQLFAEYDSLLNEVLADYTVLHYISSHDDGSPFDAMRENTFEGATKLMLAPGGAQIYYGDESARLLKVPGANGDANLRSFMNWDQLAANDTINGIQRQKLLSHYQKLGQFRREHPAVGAGRHQEISRNPFIFARILENKNQLDDKVIIAMNVGKGKINVSKYFKNDTLLTDYYHDQNYIVENGSVNINSDQPLVLLGIRK